MVTRMNKYKNNTLWGKSGKFWQIVPQLIEISYKKSPIQSFVTTGTKKAPFQPPGAPRFLAWNIWPRWPQLELKLELETRMMVTNGLGTRLHHLSYTTNSRCPNRDSNLELWSLKSSKCWYLRFWAKAFACNDSPRFLPLQDMLHPMCETYRCTRFAATRQMFSDMLHVFRIACKPHKTRSQEGMARHETSQKWTWGWKSSLVLSRPIPHLTRNRSVHTPLGVSFPASPKPGRSLVQLLSGDDWLRILKTYG